MYSKEDQKGQASQKPIVQPGLVNQTPAVHTQLYSIEGVPQPTEYVTHLEPVFVQHISRHQGQTIALMTTIGRVEGILAGVGVDHVQINLEDRSLHIRNMQIVYFEGPLMSYK
ncbi:DUF2642 domain-containing protein [Paenisporosarcina sp. TG20]|uniref:DUF2642 domain-containing protein n=1 Tax=Paenisporosarcina sp. TG20 TaxID=1211706 RepID=UPI0002E1309E|nr:DUF2642 domain-containing protein [Paenisporosarcina sp. TG20]